MRTALLAMLIVVISHGGCENPHRTHGSMVPPQREMEAIEPTEDDRAADETPMVYGASEAAEDGAEESGPPRPAGSRIRRRPKTERPRPAVAPENGESTTGAVDVPRPAPPPQPQYRRHMVRKGDTLWSLAELYLGSGKRWHEIVAANPGLDVRKLQIGQGLRIPPK